MAITAAQLIAAVEVIGVAESAAKLRAMSGAVEGAGTSLAGLAVGAAVVAGVAITAIGVKAVQMAADFQQGVNRLKTGAGDVTDNMQKMGQAILGVSVATGVASGEELKAMYLIISAHQRGAQAIDTLTAASEGAVIEQAKVADVANVLSGVMTNYGTRTFNATQFMNGLIVAVQQGKITLQDLAVAMGPIDPIARDLGISFNDVAAAMTTQTNAMIPAARAATGLRFMMQALENPTKKAIDAMKAMGLSSVDVANEMKVSLPGALQMIYDAAKKAGPEGSVPFNRAFQDMVGGMRSWSTAIALTGPHMKDFITNSELIKAAMEKNKTAVIGWDTAQQNFNMQMDRVKASASALLITIGTNLLPVLTRFAQAVVPIIANFTQFIASGQAANMIMQGFHAVMSTVMSVVAAVTPFFQTVWKILQDLGSFLAATFKPVWDQLVQTWQSQLLPALKDLWAALQPLMPLLQALGGIILAVVLVALGLLTGAIGGLVKALAGLLQGVTIIIGGVVKIFTGMVQIVSGILTFFYDLVTGHFTKLGADLGRIMSGIGNMFSGMWDVIKGIFVGAFKAIVGFVQGFISGIVGFFQHLADVLVGHSIIPDMINAIVKWFTDLPGRVLSAVGSLLGSLAGFFGNIASQAVSWGAGIIQGVINGITSMGGNLFSAIGTTVHNALASIPGVAGHVPGFASGTSYAPGGLSWVSEGREAELVVGPHLMNLPRGAGVYPLSHLGGGGGSTSGQPIQVNINIAGHNVARVLLPELVQGIRTATGAKF